MRWRVTVAAGLLLATLAGGLWCRTEVAGHCRKIEALVQQVQDAPDDRTPLLTAQTLWEERKGAFWRATGPDLWSSWMLLCIFWTTFVNMTISAGKTCCKGVLLSIFWPYVKDLSRFVNWLSLSFFAF